MSRVDLFIIDGQNDFLNSGNEPADWPKPFGGMRQGSLFVDGADKEAVLVAGMVKKGVDVWSKIHASLDAHDKNDGSHNTHWRNRMGNVVDPYTIVSYDDVHSMNYTPGFAGGVWEGQPVSARQWALNYTEALAKLGRAPLCLWPVHCQKNTWGADIYHPLSEAYDTWCDHTGGWIDFITKGDWPWTEHYSALQADVPDPSRPRTQMNTEVSNDAARADKVVWCGWAGSHCLPWTAIDGVNFFEPSDDDKNNGAVNEFITKCIVLEDACAPVPNPAPGSPPDFVQDRRNFLDEMERRGAKISTTTEVFNLL